MLKLRIVRSPGRLGRERKVEERFDLVLGRIELGLRSTKSLFMRRGVGRDAAAEQLAAGAGVDDLGAERAKVVDPLLDDRAVLSNVATPSEGSMYSRSTPIRMPSSRAPARTLVGRSGNRPTPNAVISSFGS